MSAALVEIHLHGLGAWPALADLAPRVRRAARAALDTAGDLPEGELSLTFLEDGAIRELNRRWLDRDRPTDVLAFDLSDPGRFCGDVYVGVEAVRRQAVELEVDPAEELLRCVIHGTLHVLGHHHPEEGRESSPMFRLQEELLRTLRAG